MAKKLSTLFFSTIKRAARLQRQALKQVNASIVKKPRKSVRKKTVSRARVPGLVPVAKVKAHASGKGTWQNYIYKTPPSHTGFPLRLAYSLYRNDGGSPAGLPLVVMLHGCQQTADEFARGTRVNVLADSKGFVVAYPKQSRHVQPMRCWRWFQPDAQHGIAEADAIAGLAADLVRKFRLDATRVYIAGMSAGAGMAGLVVLRHAALFAAAALHSGVVMGAAHSAAAGLHAMRRGGGEDPVALVERLVDDAQAFPDLPVMILHGEEDRVVSVENAVQLARQFSYLNGAFAVKETVLGRGTHRQYVRHDFLKAGRPLVRLCLLKGIDHAWSGGDERLKFHSEKGPSAAVLMWQFFSGHARSGGG